MRLYELLKVLDTLQTNSPALDTEVGGIHNDTRRMQQGDMFVCITGTDMDGHDYAEDALRRGASMIVSERALDAAIPHVIVPDTKAALAKLAACMAGNPAREMVMVGATGTKGKTTVTHIIKGILESELGTKTGLIGTNYVLMGDKTHPAEKTTPTTPDAVTLHRIFRDMADGGCTHCVMECSSHALDQSRVLGVEYDVGLFLNLQHDHLDYHKTVERYFEAKSRLFTQSKRAVINVDDEWGKRLAGTLQSYIGFSAKDGGGDLYARDIRLLDDAVLFTACWGDEEAEVCWHTPGMFSVYNALGALGAALALGIPLERAAKHIAGVPAVAARMERVAVPGDFNVIIDYAHTTEALENVLSTARGFTKERVLALFGCGGDRDRTKRPLMGKAAAALADVCFVTSDNPRTEEPEAIIREITAGMGDARDLRVICDRREAIYAVLNEAKSGDTVMLCGKGQETYQEVMGVKHPMDEKEIVSRWAADHIQTTI